MKIVHPEVEEYIDHHATKEPKLLEQLRRETYQKTIQPYMISGAYQGRILSLISKMIQPKRILEIGTFTGYATLCLVEGLAPNGKIITLDKNDELEHISLKFFKDSEFSEQIQYINGDALQLIPTLKDSFDLIFLDADKNNYNKYYELILPKLNSGGVILADNVLWYGKVLEEVNEKDIDTKALQTFNEKVKNDARVEVVILPIRDGISLIRKK